MKITSADIIALRPCAEWTKDRIRRVIGRGLTPTQIATRADISIADRRWALTRLAARTDGGRRALVAWAAGCAQDVAHMVADEDAARCAISTAAAWTERCATVDDVRAATADADAAAYAAYAAAAAYAAYAAAYAAASATACACVEQHLLDLATAMEAP